MPGGLMNLIGSGSENVMLTGNPSKTFFKNVYLKYTNFGLQHFRIDYTGLRKLRANESSSFTFKIPRHGDLLMDTYVVVKLPNIWSPLRDVSNGQTYEPYEFKWIKNIGCEMIEEIELTANGQTVQKITGTYLNLLSRRDFSANKKATFDEMSGNRDELHSPENANDNNGFYPNAYYHEGDACEPSIQETILYIPINFFFTFTSQQALPLVLLQYTELAVHIKFRPIKELFTIRNIYESNKARIQPNFNETHHQLYNFLVPPPDNTGEAYVQKQVDWDADIHIIAKYAFLSEDENRVLASKQQNYLIKDIYQSTYHDIAKSNIINTLSTSLVSSWTFVLRRSDVKQRNEWSNYTNMEYSTDLSVIDKTKVVHGYYVNKTRETQNQKHILNTMGILIDGKYRENIFDSGVYRYISNFSQSDANNAQTTYVYNYNFCLNTSPYSLQPSGAINFSQFKTISLELTTNTPPLDNTSYYVECDNNGDIIGVTKSQSSVYEYTYDLILIEERYNMFTIANGMCGLTYAR